MYFEKKIFLLSEQQVDAIKDTTHNAAIMRMLERIAHPEESVRNTAKKAVKTHSAENGFNSHVDMSPHPIDFSGRPVRDTDICDDDVTNLRIELALCNDSQQFINTM